MMEALAAGSNRIKNFFFVWHPKFSKRQTKSYPNEDSLAIDNGRDPAISTEEIMKQFLKTRDEDIARYSYRRTQVRHFLGDARLSSFGHGNLSGALKPIVFLDDRNDGSASRTSPGGNCRSLHTKINAQQLYGELQRPRVQPARQVPLAEVRANVAHRPEQDPEHGVITECDAERRLIYITDVSDYCVLSIIATISKTQVSFFRDFLYRYLAFRTLIGVDISTIGFKTYALEFHLPYYSWRNSSKPADDSRRMGEKPLRNCYKVEYPDADDPSTGTSDYIFEAQLSVLVTGIDDWFWTAYCFADVYFKRKRHTESVQYYLDNRKDPHSCGKFPLDRPVWNPREYFLGALVGRMEQVKQEWNNTVYQLLHRIEPLGDLIADEAINDNLGESRSTQKKEFRWTVYWLRKFTSLLSKTVSTWQVFKDGELQYFYAADSQLPVDVKWAVYLAAIDKDVKELAELRNSLQYQIDVFENMANSLATHDALEEARTMRRQSDLVRALTVITIFYLPPTLASAIFSMQANILPNVITPGDFFYTLFGLVIATLILVVNLPHIENLWKVFLTTQDSVWSFLVDVLNLQKKGTPESAGDEEASDGLDEDDETELQELDETSGGGVG